jgi:hypothetical protein
MAGSARTASVKSSGRQYDTLRPDRRAVSCNIDTLGSVAAGHGAAQELCTVRETASTEP